MANDVMKQMSEKYASRRPLDGEGDEIFLKSGSVILDAVLSKGDGVPLGKFIQISSDSGLGKTTLCLHMARVACSQGYDVAYIDDEKGVNEKQAESMGLGKYWDNGFYHYPISTFEEAEEILDAILDNENLAYIFIDSITGLIPEKVLEKSVAEVEPGLNARYAAQFLAKYKAKLSMAKGNPSVILLNQMRVKMNFRGMTTTGAAGGNGQKFYTDIRLLMRQEKKLEKTIDTMEGRKSVPYGSNNYIWAEKNRYNRPFIEGIITVLFGRGISNIAAYQRVLQSKGVLKQGGGGHFTITLPDMEPIKARGSDGVQKAIRENLTAVKKFVEENGGFELFSDEEEE